MTYWFEKAKGELWWLGGGDRPAAEVWKGPAADWLWEARLEGGTVRERARSPQAAMVAAEECLRRHGRLPEGGGG